MWLDSLSEDWVSQPRSPHSDQLRRSSSNLSIVSNTANASQSRIPRLKSRKNSNGAPGGLSTLNRTSSGSAEARNHRILKERSSSNLNVSRNRHANSPEATPSPAGARRVQSKPNASTTSGPSLSHDTIQHRTSRVSPDKENQLGSTPDWKRRIAQGNFGNAGPDLFGPIGLENIFKPPTVGRNPKAGEKAKRGMKYHPVVVEEFPSSPPAFPSDLGSIERSGGSDRRRSSLLKQMDILEEVSEGDSRYSLPRATDRDLEGNDPHARNLNRQISESTAAEGDDNEVLSQVILAGRLVSNELPLREGAESTSVKEVDVSSDPNKFISTKHGSSKPAEIPTRPMEATSPSLSDEQPVPASEWTSHSLPDDLSTGTDLYAANGGFVSIRRGGYSNEGSFNNRLLSPSSLPDFDAPELRSPSPTRRLSIRSKKINSPAKSPNPGLSAPVTPRRKQHAKSNSADEIHSSGSPLKLFDKYDTFTNDRLTRRISKFEDPIQESEEERSISDPRNEKSNQALDARPNDHYREDEKANDEHSNHRLSSFGEGQLDNFPFRADHPLQSKSRTVAVEKKPRDTSSKQDTIFQSQGLIVQSHGDKGLNVQVDVKQVTNGKRLPQSPNKDPQAKRRRTLQDSEEINLVIHQFSHPAGNEVATRAKEGHDSEINVQNVDLAFMNSKSVAGKKRKDARYDDESPAIDPKVLALRRILRPRTPTPSQRGSQQPFTNGGNLALHDEPDADHTDTTPVMDLDHQTQALAGELATFTLNMTQNMSVGGRKASVTTADFFNEAKQIMQLIRNEARPPSGHGILEEAEDEESEAGRQAVDESTMDEFSRPPSREGGSLRRLREPAQVDARVVSHLRKFEDTDDLGLALPSSVKSMHIKEPLDPSSSPDKSQQDDSQHESLRVQSDPPNVRIRAQADIPPQGHDAGLDINKTTHSSATQSYGSQSSSGPSSGRSVPTGSSQGSRGSGAKAVIAPQVVSHLLSDNVGGMTFDHKKQAWIKRKGSRNSQRLDNHSRSGSDMTENLFEDIPDLSVDEFQEQQRTAQRTVGSVKALGSVADQISNQDHIMAWPGSEQSSRPQTRDSAMSGTVEQSTAPLRFSQLVSSGPLPETRATSWGEEPAAARKATQTHIQSGNGNPMLHNEGHSEEVEHEISILEGRTSEPPGRLHRGQHQPRVVTVAFSSPLVDQRQTIDDGDNNNAWEDGSDLDLADSPVQDDARSRSASKRRTTSGFGKRSSYRSGSRRASIGLARPMSRLDENEELTFLQSFNHGQTTSMNLVLTTPLPGSRSMRHPPAHSSAHSSSIGFQLSPLSEFTVHKNDEIAYRNGNHATRHQGLLATHEVEGQLSLAVQELVKKLTDIEPYEPYWDYIRHVNLRDRGLQTLHMLDNFCAHIEDLDVSENELSQLHGAPSGVRHLQARDNCLFNLTSWSHLQHLQYLDVSDNQIASLVGFQSLVHLRELKAADNQIESLEGILELDGLIKLVLKGNSIKAVNFETSKFIHLTDLDLRHNQLVEVARLNDLPALKRLDLSDNTLESLDLPETLESLQELCVTDNCLASLDIGNLPSLRYLSVDSNSIATIDGLATHTGLQILSWREQQLRPELAAVGVQYQHCRNVRELYLSGNIVRTFAPSFHLLDLRHLELASTGLQHLPEDFGIKCPNLRSLNLNFNALIELRPLLGLVKLEKLHVAGNRICRLRRTGSVLDRIGHDLVEIDFRQNPLTMGFYAPQTQRVEQEQQLIVSRQKINPQGTDDEKYSELRDCSTYTLPRIELSADDAARQRLDEDTEIRRRVYEMLIALRCKSLRRLDGLCLDRRKVATKDEVWNRLEELGVLTSKGGSEGVERASASRQMPIEQLGIREISLNHSWSFALTIAYFYPPTNHDILSNIFQNGMEFNPRHRNDDLHGSMQSTALKSIKSLSPLLDRILVQRVKAEAKTAGGLFLPESSVKELNEAKVLAVGPGGLDKEGKRVTPSVAPGDKVLIPQYGGSPVKVGEEEYSLFRDHELLAKINE
ncbi:MAG: hypothetical protein Q9169_002891 [Polycauliona sp. 2 TL-2023]